MEKCIKILRLAGYVTISTGVPLLLVYCFHFFWAEEAMTREVRATNFTLARMASEAKMKTEITNNLVQSMSRKLKVLLGLILWVESKMSSVIFRIFPNLKIYS